MLFNNDDLLLSDEAWSSPNNLYSCWNAKGLYSPLQFVLRLRPDIHRALNAAPAGLVMKQDLTEDQILAFSTFLHETIHWWQHVGTTSGLVLSLLYPAQAHVTRDDLLRILAAVGPVKSILNLNADEKQKGPLPAKTQESIDTALNNWHDIEFCKLLMIDPNEFHLQANDSYFESSGHSYSVALVAVMSVIAATIDPKFDFLPDPALWDSKYLALRENETPNFFYGSDLYLPGIGAREIFEGQARISQLQYLAHASGQRLTWSEFQTAGFLKGVYGSAFEYFSTATGLKIPEELDASPFALFLLICDISLNPVEGVIHDFPKYEDVITTFDPGWRFVHLCSAVKLAPEIFESAITDYSKEEYFQLSNQLCEMLDYLPPRILADRVTQWAKDQPQVIALLEEDRTFEFAPQNLPVRVFMARFLRLQLDKAECPQFFCWPGVSMTVDRAQGVTAEAALALFEEHRALFLDKEDGDVYPRTFIDRDAGNVDKVFNDFYSWVATYDLARQWLVADGPFAFEFSWLTSKYSESEIEQWATRHFANVYGHEPTGYMIIPKEET